MTLRIFRISAAFVFGTALLASSTLAQTHPAAPQSPYGGTTVEEMIARVNDQIITRSDYDRAMKELDDEARQRGASLQGFQRRTRICCATSSTSSSGFPKARSWASPAKPSW
jgi:hypothetical protein